MDFIFIYSSCIWSFLKLTETIGAVLRVSRSSRWQRASRGVGVARDARYTMRRGIYLYVFEWSMYVRLFKYNPSNSCRLTSTIIRRPRNKWLQMNRARGARAVRRHGDARRSMPPRVPRRARAPAAAQLNNDSHVKWWLARGAGQRRTASAGAPAMLSRHQRRGENQNFIWYCYRGVLIRGCGRRERSLYELARNESSSRPRLPAPSYAPSDVQSSRLYKRQIIQLFWSVFAALLGLSFVCQ